MRKERKNKTGAVRCRWEAVLAVFLCCVFFGLQTAYAASIAQPQAAETEQAAETSQATETVQTAETLQTTETAQMAEEAEAVPEAEEEVSLTLSGTGTGGEGIRLSLSYGFQNIAKSGSYLPIDVKVENGTGEPIKGQLSVELPTDGVQLRYVYPVEVAAGRFSDVRGTVTATDQVSSVRMRLTSETGDVLAERSVSINVQGSGSELLIGLLSNHPEELSFFRGLTVGGAELKTRTVTLNPGDIPVTSGALDQLNVIVISDFNVNRLSEEITEAILTWVEGGGVLLLGTGKAGAVLGSFSDALPDHSLSALRTAPVDMGMKYSTNGPDGAVMELSVRALTADEGIELQQSGDLALLTAFSVGNGVIGVTAYDLCDIRSFATQQMSYPSDLLQQLIGSARLGAIASEGQSGGSYSMVRSLTGVENPARRPNIALYLIVSFVYLLLIGPVLYFGFRRKGLSVFYPAAVVFSAFVFAAAVWFVGYPVRFEGPFAEYASILRISGENRELREYVSLSVPNSQNFSLTLPENYAIQPVIRSSQLQQEEAQGLIRLSGENQGVIEINHTGETIRLSAEALTPFDAQCFELISREAQDAGEGFLLHASFDGTNLTGTIQNNTQWGLENVWLLMDGRMVSVGGLAAGEKRDLSGTEVIVGPTSAQELTSTFLSGIGRMEMGSAGYLSALTRTRLLSALFLEELRQGSGIRLIGFSTEPQLSVQKSGMDAHGTTLVTALLPDALSGGDGEWRSGLATEPSLVSGAYDAAANLIAGTAALELEYSLGTDLSIEALRFESLSAAFDGQDESGRISAFRGAYAMYNYTEGSYDLISSANEIWDSAALWPYLSPSNTITVRYIPDENADEGTRMFLPVPFVRGTSKL